MFWVGFFVYGINGVIWAYSMDVGSRALAGTAAGILEWSAYMGAALQAMIFGYVLDKTCNWMILFATIAILCIIVVILAIIVIWRGVIGRIGEVCREMKLVKYQSKLYIVMKI